MRPVTNESKGWRIAQWTVSVLLALQFLAAGIPKLLRVHQAVEGFHKAGYSTGFLLFIGLCEVSGAIGLLIPRLRFWAASGLVFIMVGALYTLTHTGESVVMMIPAAVCLVLLVFLAWRNFPGRSKGVDAPVNGAPNV